MPISPVYSCPSRVKSGQRFKMSLTLQTLYVLNILKWGKYLDLTHAIFVEKRGSYDYLDLKQDYTG